MLINPDDDGTWCSDRYTLKETMEYPKHYGIHNVSNTQCAHSSHITSLHITSQTHTHTHTQGCQDDLGIPLILMDIKIISALIRQNALEYKNKKGDKTICRRGYRYAEMTQLRTANYQFYTTKFCLGSITFTPKHFPHTNDGMEHHCLVTKWAVSQLLQ